MTYIITGNTNVDGTLIFGTDTKIIGDGGTDCSITRVAGGSRNQFFEHDNGSGDIDIEGVQLNGSTYTLIGYTATHTGNSPDVSIKGGAVYANNLCNFKSGGNFVFEDVTLGSAFTPVNSGFVFSTSHGKLHFRNCNVDGVASGTDLLDLGVGTFTDIDIRQNVVDLDTGSVFLKGSTGDVHLASSSNYAQVKDNKVVGTGTALATITTSEPRWQFTDNKGLLGNTPTTSGIVVTEVSTNYTQTVSEEVIVVDNSAGAITITLLAPSDGLECSVIKKHTTGGNVVIQPTSGNIQNNTSLTIDVSAEVGSVQCVSTATEWWIR
jgi:hypothetical protein